MKHSFIFISCLSALVVSASNVSLPILIKGEQSIDNVHLTRIGQFGIWRDDRPGVPGHFHTGIDIMRPSKNYNHEPIFSIANGIVISKRDDGPYAQLIIEHQINEKKFWAVYEHIAGIQVSVNDTVEIGIPIARFMNRDELNRYGWQFDHLHFEVLKTKPIKLATDPNRPERHYKSYSLLCYTRDDLNKYFYNPIEFFMLTLR